MITAHVSASLSRYAGGIFEIELALAHHLERLGVDVRALGLEDDQWSADAERWTPVRAEVVTVTGPMAFGYSRAFLPKMETYGADLAHLHSLWMYPSVAIHRWSQRTGKPYLVTPNGMLEPWALRNSARKKRLAGLFYENRCLRGASCLQANTRKELADFRAYGLNNPVCVIPNGVDLPEDRTRVTGVGDQGADHRPRILLFLGRLHPKKGLVNALRAWASLQRTANSHPSTDNWAFVIAGWDQGGHEVDLKRLCKELDLSYAVTPASDFTDNRQLTTAHNGSSVLFTGPAFGETKDALLRSASAFILPSFSEGLPMSVLEAWSYGLPVLMTEHCNLSEGFAADAAIQIGTNVDSIAEGMRRLLSLQPTDNGHPTTSLDSLGRNGRALVERQYTWPMVAAQMKEVYEWVLGGGQKPGSVE
jgi:glycosyltransferase involved in cell wall biosynthesis